MRPATARPGSHSRLGKRAYQLLSAAATGVQSALCGLLQGLTRDINDESSRSN